MVEIEKRSAGTEKNDFLYLGKMKVVRAALEEEVRREFGALDLERLKKAVPEDQKRMVKEAFVKAGQEYDRLVYRDKKEQLKQTEKAFEEGRLTLPELLQGLEFQLTAAEGGDRKKSFMGKLNQFFKRG